MNLNNLKPYNTFGSMQVPWYLAKLRNIWVALVTAPNKLSIEILDNIAEKADNYTNKVSK